MFRTFIRPTIVLTLMTSIILGQSTRAEETPDQDRRQHDPQMMGHLWLSAVPHLNEEEYKAFSKLMSKGLERRGVELKKKVHQEEKVTDSLTQEQRDEAAKVLGHLWLSIRPHLTKEETRVLSELMNKGIKRHHLALQEKEQHAKGGK